LSELLGKRTKRRSSDGLDLVGRGRGSKAAHRGRIGA
jgi:hypothetical protein